MADQVRVHGSSVGGCAVVPDVLSMVRILTSCVWLRLAMEEVSKVASRKVMEFRRGKFLVG